MELEPIELECNMGKDINGVEHREPWKAYDIDEVNGVIASKDNEIRRLKRAVWLARALRAEARKNYWYARSIHEGDERLWSIDGSAVKYIGCIKRTNFDWLKIWCEVEIKCLAMAEKFK